MRNTNITTIYGLIFILYNIDCSWWLAMMPAYNPTVCYIYRKIEAILIEIEGAWSSRCKMGARLHKTAGSAIWRQFLKSMNAVLVNHIDKGQLFSY